MSHKEAVRQFKKDLIIDAALVLFQEHTYEEVTVQDIAGAAGIGKATLYQYFSSKEEIMFHLMMRIMDDINGQLLQCCQSHADPRQVLEDVIEQVYHLYLEQNRLFLAFLELKLQKALKPEWLEEAWKKRDEKYRILSRLLQQGVEQGVFIQADSLRLARILFNILRGYSMEYLERLGNSGTSVEYIDLELIRSLVFRGIIADGGGKKVE